MGIKKNIEEHIGAYLAGESTLEERKYIENWMNEHPDNLHEFKKYKTIWNLKKSEQSDKKKTFKELTNRIQKQQVEEKKKKQIDIYFNVLRIAAGLLILISSYFLIRYFVSNNQSSDPIEYITKEVPYGKKTKLQLPDGSYVHLNSGSSIQYPESFNQNERKILLTGEAFFEVVASDKPFVIGVNEHKIVVLGTTFNVKNNLETGNIETVVVTGKVKFTSDSLENFASEIFIDAGEKLQYDKSTKQIQKISIDNFDDIAWRDGILAFKNDAMKNVFSELEKWYGVTFDVSNVQILQCSLTAKFDNESLQEILDYIDVIMPLDYSFSKNNDSIMVQGKGCFDFHSSRHN